MIPGVFPARELEGRSVSTLPTGHGPVERLLGRGLLRGGMTEISAPSSAGRFTLLLSFLSAVTQAGQAAALVDFGDHLSVGDASDHAIDLSRLLWIRPRDVRKALMAAEMALGAGFPLVALDLGVERSPLRRLAATSWVRLARATESGRGALLVSTPCPMTGSLARTVIRVFDALPRWHGRSRSPSLLGGLSARLFLAKNRFGPSNRQESFYVQSALVCRSRSPAMRTEEAVVSDRIVASA